MKCNKRILEAKLKDRSGFTLAEQLISVIFLGLLILAVGVGMSAALNISNKASIVTAADQLMKRSIQEVNNELIFAIQVESDGPNPDAKFLSASTRTIVGFTNEIDGSGTSSGIALVGEGVGGQNVDSVILVPSTSNLVPHISGLVYNEGNDTWSYTIQIVNENSSSGEVIREQAMTVARNFPNGT